MRIAFFEDDVATELHPLTLTRPTFELVCGRFSVRERLLRHWDVQAWGAFVRAELAETYHEAHPECRVNDWHWLNEGPTLLINGRWLPDLDQLGPLNPDDAGIADNELVYLTLDPLEVSLLTEESWHDTLTRIVSTRRTVAAAGRLLHHPWELISHNGELLEADFRSFPTTHPGTDIDPRVAILGCEADVSIHPSAVIDPFTVLDARQGPISISADVQIKSFTSIEGPCHIGIGTHLMRADIKAETTIGPHCRVGGEIENSILHGYVNKAHAGFLGHSYVCPWSNLGALTTNSDLKNDYSSVRVPINGQAVETGMLKVGCFIGDHTKTALGTLLNTGASVGVMSMILPPGGLAPKYIPSFSRLWKGELIEEPQLDQQLASARTMMGRRDCLLTDAQIRLLRHLFEQTSGNRQQAIHRALDRNRIANAVSP